LGYFVNEGSQFWGIIGADGGLHELLLWSRPYIGMETHKQAQKILITRSCDKDREQLAAL